HPHYRHPSFTDVHGKLMIEYVFAVGGYQFLDTRTPAPNKAARRWVQRIGFSKAQRHPKAEWQYEPNGERRLVDVLYSTYTRADWEARPRVQFADDPSQDIPPATPMSAQMMEAHNGSDSNQPSVS